MLVEQEQLVQVAAQVEELKLRARALSARVAASTTSSELNRIEGARHALG